MPRQKKYKPPHTTLTTVEKRLLEYPPNEDTWVCEDEKEYGICGMVNTGREEVCSWCSAVKPTRAKLLWPQYIIACNKVGIEPKSALWRESPNTGRPMIRYNGERWHLWEPPERPVETITRVKKGKVRTRTVKAKNV
jgi:hypothetical protein